MLHNYKTNSLIKILINKVYNINIISLIYQDINIFIINNY